MRLPFFSSFWLELDHRDTLACPSMLKCILYLLLDGGKKLPTVSCSTTVVLPGWFPYLSIDKNQSVSEMAELSLIVLHQDLHTHTLDCCCCVSSLTLSLLMSDCSLSPLSICTIFLLFLLSTRYILSVYHCVLRLLPLCIIFLTLTPDSERKMLIERREWSS